MTTLQKGSKAPDFSLKDKDGSTHSLKQTKSNYTVVFFYPKDDTPGCTIEANEFSAALAKFAKAGAAVFGISGGNEKSKEKFCNKYGIKITLLSDTDFSVATAYGCYGEKKFMGRAYMGIFRSTFLLDASKKVIKVFSDVKPEGHAAELLSTIKALAGGFEPNATESSKKAPSKGSSAKKSSKKTVTKKTSKKATAKK